MREKDELRVLPLLSPEEFEGLKEDIRQHGVLVPLAFDDQGNLLDGHHRVRAWRELRDEGYEVPDPPRTVLASLKTDEDRRARARALNLQRRQLTQRQKREVIRDQLRETPKWSDRRIARLLAVDDHTVRSRRL